MVSVGRATKRRRPNAAAHQLSNLPIYAYKDRLLAAIKSKPVLIVVGETGSGKTTQLPQYICDAGLARQGNKMICVTQPRRVAAVTVATRVASERGEKIGGTVGYCVRFDEKVSRKTQVCRF